VVWRTDFRVADGMRTPWEVRQERWQQEEREENNQASRARTHLQAALVELLDGDGDAVPPAVGRADEALVDAAEAALAELLERPKSAVAAWSSW